MIAARRVWKHIFHSIRRSLQVRTVFFAVLLGLVVAILFSVVSVSSVRATMIDQAIDQSQKDFTDLSIQAQNSLNSADTMGGSQTQRLVVDLATQLQSQAAPNLVGVYMWPQDYSTSNLVPVSTDLNSVDVVTPEMRGKVASAIVGSLFYQPVDVASALGSAEGVKVPGAVLGTVLRFPSDDELEFFSVYSFTNEQSSLEKIQWMLFLTSIILSLSMGFFAWLLLRTVVKPVQKVAAAAKSLAGGDLEARVDVNRRDEIGSLQKSFNTMAGTVDSQIAQLEEASVAQQRFVSDVSHELRTPVTTMRMATDLLVSRKEDFAPSTKRTVELLAGQVSRFEKMLADLLDVSRYDAKHADFTLVNDDLREPIRSAREVVSQIALSRGTKIQLHLPDHIVLTTFDRSRIVGVVRNLLSNAIDFSAGKPIDVTLYESDDAAAIVVRDHGTGISAEKLPHIFDRFWRGDPSRSRETGGSGLGLSIVEQNVDLHRGAIDVHSQPGQGTCFIVTLPRRCEPEGTVSRFVTFVNENSLEVTHDEK